MSVHIYEEDWIENHSIKSIRDFGDSRVKLATCEPNQLPCEPPLPLPNCWRAKAATTMAAITAPIADLDLFFDLIINPSERAGQSKLVTLILHN